MEIKDDITVVVISKVKIYDDKWVDFYYAADPDGAHTDIFGTVVVPIEKEQLHNKLSIKTME